MKLIAFELRDAFRRLLARPGYSMLSLLVLTGGLGSFLLMLSLVDAFILKPTPFPDADRLVSVTYARSEQRSDLQGIPGSRVRELRGAGTLESRGVVSDRNRDPEDMS